MQIIILGKDCLISKQNDMRCSNFVQWRLNYMFLYRYVRRVDVLVGLRMRCGRSVRCTTLHFSVRRRVRGRRVMRGSRPPRALSLSAGHCR